MAPVRVAPPVHRCNRVGGVNLTGPIYDAQTITVGGGTASPPARESGRSASLEIGPDGLVYAAGLLNRSGIYFYPG